MFKDPDTGYDYQGSSMEDLQDRITRYREQNNLEQLDALHLVIENYMCLLPENVGACEVNRKVHRSIRQYLKGGIAIAKNLLYNKVVSQKAADTRSFQCARCPNNTFPDRSNFVRWSDDIAEAAVGVKKSLYHNQLGNCAVCSCPLRAKVWFGGDIRLSEEEKTEMAKVDCWQVKLSK